jgi:uncharacterized protein YutE (UPF0331/DUF86 family)
MLEKDAVLSKISIIKRCLDTIKRATNLEEQSLEEIFTQDIFILNVQRSIQATIDIANILIAVNGWKLPASYKESFSILAENKVIAADMAEKLKKMCGFRNIAVHDYQEITPPIMQSIMTHHLKDFEEFYSVIYNYADKIFLSE